MDKKLNALFSQRDLATFTKQRNDINILFLCSLYLLSLGLIVMYSSMNSLILVIAGILIMGAVQHTLATFVHEAAHLNLFTNRRLNDFFGHLLCSAPLLSYLKDYRYFHFEHHRHAGKIDKDPELELYRAMGVRPFFESREEVFKVFIQDFTGVNYLRSLKHLLPFFLAKRKAGVIEVITPIDHLCVLAWAFFVPLIFWKLGLLVPYLLFWVLPLLTITPTLLRWHGFGEHIREKNGCPSENTLTHQFSLISTIFLYPINSSYHLEHHLYPQIPWYSLKKFYRWAIKHPIYNEKSQKLTVDGLFTGTRTVIDVAFPIHREPKNK